MVIKKPKWKFKFRYVLAAGGVFISLLFLYYMYTARIFFSYPDEYNLMSVKKDFFGGYRFFTGVHLLEFKRDGVSYFALIEVPATSDVYLLLEKSDLRRPVRALPEGEY